MANSLSVPVVPFAESQSQTPPTQPGSAAGGGVRPRPAQKAANLFNSFKVFVACLRRAVRHCNTFELEGMESESQWDSALFKS